MPTAAPLDRGALERTNAPFYEARTLPREAYLSEAVFEWERAHFFESSWCCVGRSEDLALPGSQRALQVGREGVLLVRDENEKLRAFSNTCRHRGHELLPCGGDAAMRNTVRCPYHRWTYALDGTFKGGPGFAGQQGFDRSDPEHSLIGFDVREWHGWIFVDVSGRALSFESHVGNLDDVLAPYEPARMATLARHDYVVKANWKIIVENYHECYHCTEIHPELCRVSSPQSGEGLDPTGLWVGGTMELLDGVETMSLDGSSGGARTRGLDAAAARDVGYFMLWPNVLVSPHPDYVMTHLLEPLDPGHTRVVCEWSFPPEASAIEGFDPSYAADFWDVTNRQDWNACESVQRGVTGAGYRQAPFSEQEVQVYEFDVMVARGYLAGSVTEPVPHFADVRR